MSSITYSSKKSVYKIKQDDQLIFVFDKYAQPPFWELKFDNIPELVKRTDFNEDVMFQKRNGPGNKKYVSIFEFELAGNYEFRVTHQSTDPSKNFSHIVTVNVERPGKKSGCEILQEKSGYGILWKKIDFYLFKLDTMGQRTY